MPALKPKVRGDITVVEIEGEAVVYDPGRVSVYHLNPTATVLLKLCDGTGTVRELAEDIAEVFGLPMNEVHRNVKAVIQQFKAAGILDGKARAKGRTDG